MNRLLPTFLFLTLGVAPMPSAFAQDALPEIDLLYPQFAHPQRDAADAIKRRDYRFIAVDRERKIVPGTERYSRLKAIYHTKYVRQPFRLFPSHSENFSFELRARAYADQYNRALIRYLLVQRRKMHHDSHPTR